jgi:hypothetical protein
MRENQDWQMFFEELSGSDKFYNESLEPTDTEGFQGGLTKENVYKLTEDLLNPLPPSDEN